MRGFFSMFFSYALLSQLAFANPQSLSYQGRILDSSGNPLEAPSVQFRFTVLSPDGTCELWTETKTAINMTGSDGIFDQTIGPSAGLMTVLENGVNHACLNSGNFTGLTTDNRKLKVEFSPNGGMFREITPHLEINAVPYAAMAQKSSVSERVGSLAEADILTRALAPTCVAANSFLQWNGTDFDCVAATTGAGTVTNVTSTNAYLTVATGTSTPALTVNVGTTAGTVAAGDDARFTDSRTPTGTAGGDLTGTYPNPVLTNTTVTPGEYPKVTVDAKGRVTAGAALVAADIPNLDASKITTGNITNNVSNSSTTSTTGSFGTASANSVRLYDGVSEYLVQVYPSGGTGYTITWPGNQGAASTVLQNDGSGNLSWVVPPSAPVTSVAGRTGAVTLSNTDISGLGTSATLNVAAAGNAAAGEVVKGDDTRLTDGRAPTGTAGGDLSGTYPNPTVARIQGRAVNAAAPTSAGQALMWDGAEWVANNIRAEDIRTAWGGTQIIPAVSCTASQAMVWNVITDRFTCQNIANLDAAAIATGVIAPARLGTGTADNTTFLRGDGTWQTISAGAGDILQNGNSFGTAMSIGTNDNFNLNFETNLLPRMTITNAGRVGIGSTTPGTNLQVDAASGDGVEFSLGQLGFNDNGLNTGGNTNAIFTVFGLHHANGGAVVQGFSTGSSSSLMLGGVSTTTPNAGEPRVVIEGGKKGAGSSAVNLADTEVLMRVQKWDSTPLIDVMGSGFTGILTTNPSTALDLNGALTVREITAPALSPADQGRIYFDSATNKFRVSENGGAYVDLIGSGGLTGSGTTNFLPKFTSGTAIGDSAIREVSGQVSIGGAAVGSSIFTVVGGDANINGLRVGRGPANDADGVAIGVSALANATTGYANTAIGSSTLTALTTQFENVAVGTNAGMMLTSGTNTAVGALALTNATGGGGGSNTAIGARALSSGAANTGSWNTALGARAGGNITSGNFNIIIGADINAPSPTGEYQLNIGDLIFGDMTPASRMLDVNGALNVRGLASAPSLSATDSGKIYFDSAIDRLRVSLNGGAYADLLTNMGGFTPNQAIIANGGGVATSFTCPTGQVLGFDVSGFATCTAVPSNGGTFLAGNGSATNPSFAFSSDINTGLYRSAEDTINFSLGGSSLVTFQNSGGNPVVRVDGSMASVVANPTAYTPTSSAGSSVDNVGLGLTNFGQTTGIFAGLEFQSSAPGPLFQKAYMGAISNAAGNTPTIVLGQQTGATAYSERMRIDAAGNVGIGTTDPQALLQLGTPTSSLGTLRLAGSTSGFVQIQPNAAAGSWNMTLPANDGDPGQVLQTNGSGVTSWTSVPTNGGVFLAANGTAAAPGFSFNSNPDTGINQPYAGAIGFSVDGTNRYQMDGNSFYGNENRSFFINPYTPINTNPTYSFVNDANTGMYSPSADTLRFTTNATDRVTITDTGRVGIGTSSPSGTLHVDGGTASGATTAGDSITIKAQNANGPGGAVGGDINFTTGTGTSGFRSGLVNFDVGTGGAVGVVGNHSAVYTSSGTSIGELTYSQSNTFAIDETYTLSRYSATNASANIQHAYMAVVSTPGAGVYSPSIVWGQRNGLNSYQERFRIDSSGNIGVGVTNPSSIIDINGSLTARGLGAVPANSPAGQGRIYFDSALGRFRVSQNGGAYVDLVAAGGGGISSLGGQTGSTQTFAVDASGTAPAINSASNTHTLSIPLASGAGVTSGTISKTDYDSFVAKLTSPLTTKGDLLTRDGSSHIRLPAGTDGQVLAANSVTASGLEWRNLSVSDISGTLPVANGGTGATTLSAGNLLVGNGTSPLDSISAGSAGNVLYASGISSWASGAPDIAGLVDKSSTQTLTGAKAFTNYIQMATQNAIRFADSDSTNYVAIRAPATVGADVTLTLPATAGSNGQVLTTDGTGVLSWSSPSSGSSLGINTARVAARFNEITANPPSGLLTVDGITLVAGDRVMINSPGFGNSGVWIAAAGSWTRASDLDNWSEAQGYRVYVKEGTVQKGRTFVADAPTAGSFAANELLWISEGTTSNNESATASDSSVFFGFNVAPGITSSNSANVGIGPNALSSLTTGTYNIAIGRSPLQSVTTGNNNIGLGFASLVLLSSGYNNTSIGYVSGYNTTTGFENVYLGTSSGNSATTAAQNVAIGTSSLQSNVAKQQAVAIGFGSMARMHGINTTTEVTFNTAVGANSLAGDSFASANTGIRNTAVGHSALSLISSGSGNIGLGHNAGSAVTTGSNNVIIGSNTGSSFASGNNNISINDGAGTERIRVIADGNVGIGTAVPRAKLEVSGAIQVSSDVSACAAGRVGSIRLNGTSLEFCNGTTWNLISTGAGGSVSNVTSANAYISIVDNTTTPTITANVGTSANTLAAGDDSRIVNSFQQGGNSFGVSATIGTNDNNAFNFETNNTTNMTILPDGNVGIGTTSPFAKVDIVSTGGASSTGFNMTHNRNGPADGEFTKGAYFELNVNGATEDYSMETIYGIQSRATTSNSHTAPMGSLTGIQSTVSSNSTNTVGSIQGISSYATISSSTVSQATGVYSFLNFGGGTTAEASLFDAYSQIGGSSNVTNLNLFYGRSPFDGSSGAYTNVTGLKLDEISVGTVRRAIHYNHPSTPFVVQGNGSVGVGTSSPAAILDVTSTGTSSAIIVPRATTGNRPTAANGMIRYNTTTTLFEFYQNGAWVNYTTVSDGRLKAQVKSVNNGLNILNKLNPVFYNWDRSHPKTEGFEDKRQIGFIAQEVEKVLPEVVNEGEDTYRSLEYDKMVAVAIAAIKELYAQVIGIKEDQAVLSRKIASKADKAETENIKAEVIAKTAKLEEENKIIKDENKVLKQRLDAQQRELEAIKRKLGM